MRWGGASDRVVLVARLPRRPDERFTVWLQGPRGVSEGLRVDPGLLQELDSVGDRHVRFWVNLVLFWHRERVAGGRVRRLSIDEVAAMMYVGDAPTGGAQRRRRHGAREVMRWFAAGGYLTVDEEFGGYRLLPDESGKGVA